MIWVFSPAGFEQYFLDIGSRSDETSPVRGEEEWHEVDHRHATEYR